MPMTEDELSAPVSMRFLLDTVEQIAGLSAATSARELKPIRDEIAYLQARVNTQEDDLRNRRLLEYVDTYEHGREYRKGQMVTSGGSLWHCNAPATKVAPGEAGGAWTLTVKAGKDAKGARGNE